MPMLAIANDRTDVKSPIDQLANHRSAHHTAVAGYRSDMAFASGKTIRVDPSEPSD